MTDDTISRSAALNALCAVCGKACDKSEFVYNAPQDEQVILCPEHYCLCTLPSAQPSVSKTEIVGDVISRAAVVDAIDGVDWYHQNKNGEMVHGASDKEQAWYKAEDIYHVLDTLPSAQPEPIRINLNEPIKVKLTDWGKEIYYHQYDRTNQIAGREICKPKFPKEDENGYTEFQLWCFIELYGMHMGMTLPNVIEPLEIVYER